MKTFIGLCLLLLGLPLCAGVRDTTPPTIEIGLTQFNKKGQIVPDGLLPLPLNRQVSADARGLVHLRAKVSDAGGIRSANITVPYASATLPRLSPPVPHAYIGTSWIGGFFPAGTKALVKVRVTDAAGNTATQSVEVTVKK